MPNINQRMATGIVWMVGAKLMDRSIGIVSTLILARLLVPDDFGLVAMATAIGGMLDLLGAFSFDVALIQNTKAERRHYDTVWTFNAIIGMCCAAGLVLLAVPAAGWYREPRLATVMYILSLSYVMNAFTNVGIVNFRKELNFHKEFILIFTRRVVTFIVTMTAAYLLRSYWALLIGMTIGKFVAFTLSYTMNSYRPKFSLAAGKELFDFSKWMLLHNILQFLRHDGCTFIIGRVFGAKGLGIYAVSYEISNLPSTELVAPIARVALPGFAKISDVAIITQSYLRLMGIITLVILPIGIGIAAVASPLVLAALGPNWLAAIPLIAILGINGAIESTQTNNAAVCFALGQPKKVMLVNTTFVLVFFPALYIFMHKYGMIGVGYAYLVAQAVAVPLGMTVIKRFLQFRWMELAAVVWRPIVAGLAMYAVVTEFDTVVVSWFPWLRLLADAGVGAVTYTAIVLLLWAMSGRATGAETFCLTKAKLMKA